jgi:hypothetical protein
LNTGDCSIEVTGLVGYVLVGDVNTDIIFTLLKVFSIFDRRNVSMNIGDYKIKNQLIL